MKSKKAKIAFYILLSIIIGSIAFYIGMKSYDSAYQDGFRAGVQFVLDELLNMAQRK